MLPLVALLIQVLAFIVLPWVLWKLARGIVPVVVLPILIGLLLSFFGYGSGVLVRHADVARCVGLLGVMLLSFGAGIEMRMMVAHSDEAGRRLHLSPIRLIACAGVALALPFVVGVLLARVLFEHQPSWQPGGVPPVLAQAAIGLCLAVSALPVLIGVVRQLRPQHRGLGHVALLIAVADDAVLWSGLALLLAVSSGMILGQNWGLKTLFAVIVLMLVPVVSSMLNRQADRPVGLGRVLLVSAVWLTACSWATSVLGLHAILGAYLAGILLPRAMLTAYPLDRSNHLALFAMAPLFFGLNGLGIDGEVLEPLALGISVLLVMVAMAAKTFAVVWVPPVANLTLRERLGLGVLLQCKGLMEIVAATILRDRGLLTEQVYAVLVCLAVISTALTLPLFNLALRKRGRRPVIEPVG